MPSLNSSEFIAFATQLAAADGQAAFNDDSLLGFSNRQHCAFRDSAGQLSGVMVWQQHGAQVEAELAVTPALRRTGIGTALVRETVQRADPHTSKMLLWAHGNTSAQQGFAERLGMQAVRTLYHLGAEIASSMPRHAAVPSAAVPGAAVPGAAVPGAAVPGAAVPGAELPDGNSPAPQLSDVKLPAGFQIRAFTPADSAAWVQLNSEIFASHPEQGRLTQTDLAARLEQPWANPANFLLLTDPQGQLCGYNWLKTSPATAEIYVLGVAPQYAGAGYGKLLLHAGMQRLQKLGYQRVELYVDGSNTAAMQLYRKAGFTPLTIHTQYQLNTAAVQRLKFSG